MLLHARPADIVTLVPRPLIAALALLAALAAAPAASAEVPARCRELFVESLFDGARDCLDEALDAQQGSPAAVAELFAHRAAVLTALRLDEDARESMEVVLSLEPGWQAEDPLLTSPRILELVETVRQAFDVSAGRPSIEHEAGGDGAVSGDALVVEARAPNVEAPLEPVLMVRRAGEARYRVVPLRGRPGRALSARVPLEVGERVEYYVAVRVPGGWEALRSGSPESPFAASRTGQGEAPGPGGDEPGLGERYWWVWTIAGVAAVGLAVGLGVGLALGAEDETGSVRLHFP